MSVAYYIVLDNDDPGFETFVNGKAVAHAIDDLDGLCDASGLARLESFVGQSAEDYADLLGEEIEFPEGQESGNLWFEPEAGIAWVDALMAAINASPDTLRDRGRVLDDLAEYKKVLVQARDIGARWHLALDI